MRLAPGLGADATRSFVAVEDRHADVEQREVRLALLRQLERLRAVRSLPHFVAVAFEQQRQAFERVRIVVGDQDAMTRHCSGRRCAPHARR